MRRMEKRLRNALKGAVIAISALLLLAPVMARADNSCGNEAFGANKVKPCPGRTVSCYLVYPKVPLGFQPTARGVFFTSEFGPDQDGTAYNNELEVIGVDVDTGFLQRTSNIGLETIWTKLTPEQLRQLICLANQVWETDVVKAETMEGEHAAITDLAPHNSPDLYDELVLRDGDSYQVLRDAEPHIGATASLLALMEKIAASCRPVAGTHRYGSMRGIYMRDPNVTRMREH
jgi:hypothetical protein